MGRVAAEAQERRGRRQEGVRVPGRHRGRLGQELAEGYAARVGSELF